MAGWSWLPPSLRPVGAAGRPLALMRSADRSPDRTDHGGRSWVPGEPIMRTSSRLVDHHGFCRPRSDRCCHHVEDHPRSWLRSIVSSAVSCGPIGLAAAQHRPDDPGALVGHRRDHDVERPPIPQAVDPAPGSQRRPPEVGAGCHRSTRVNSPHPNYDTGSRHSASIELEKQSLPSAQPSQFTARGHGHIQGFSLTNTFEYVRQ